MVIQVNPPPVMRLPEKFLNDDEVRPYFEYRDEIIFKLWQRSGGGTDIVGETENIFVNLTQDNSDSIIDAGKLRAINSNQDKVLQKLLQETVDLDTGKLRAQNNDQDKEIRKILQELAGLIIGSGKLRAVISTLKHSALNDLVAPADDHPQYLNETRHNALDVPQHGYFAAVYTVDPNGTARYTTVEDALADANADVTQTDRILVLCSAGEHIVGNGSGAVQIAQYVSLAGVNTATTRFFRATIANPMFQMERNCSISDCSFSTTGIAIQVSYTGNFGQNTFISRAFFNACSVGVEVLQGTVKIRDIISSVNTVLVRGTNSTRTVSVLLENSVLSQTSTVWENTGSFASTFTFSKCVQDGFFVNNSMVWSIGTVISSYNTFNGAGFGGNGIYVMSGTAILKDSYCSQTTNEVNFQTTGPNCVVDSTYGKWYAAQFVLNKVADTPSHYIDITSGVLFTNDATIEETLTAYGNIDVAKFAAMGTI